MTPSTAQRGSALLYIFIGIALFGALMFMFSRQTTQNISSINAPQNSLSATDIIDQGRSLEAAVKKIVYNGCSENQISFDPPPYTANTNPDAPSDYHCHVFHQNGGRLNYQIFPNWVFSSHASIAGAGSDYTEIIGALQGLSEAVCQKINDQLRNGFTTIPMESGYFLDSAYYGQSPTDPSSVRWIVSSFAGNVSSGCINSDSHTPYIYYHALLVR
jgi:hypothetical protein